MWFFKNNSKVKTPAPAPPECNHKWKDFDWYLEEWYIQKENEMYEWSYKVIEPYICVLCHKRKDMVLDKDEYDDISKKEMRELKKEVISNYPLIKPRGIIENDINDFMMVDREYLKILDKLRGNEEEIKNLTF